MRTYFSLILSLCCLLGAFSAAPALAQEAAPQSHSFDDIPDVYLEEATAFEEKCSTDPHLSRYYNCECLAVKFLDERIERGPAPSQSFIMQAIQGQCFDTIKLAGEEYTRCLNGNFDDEELSKRCACIANTQAKLHELSRSAPTSRKNVAIKSRALTMCKNPDLARRLYAR